MRKMVLCFLIALACFMVAFVVIRWWVVSHLDFSYVGQVTEVNARDVAQNVDAVARGVEEGKLPWRKLDLTSVGAQGKEAQLVELRRLLQVFEVGLGRAPKDASDLKHLTSQRSLSFSQRRLVEKDASECEIFTFPQDSYLLNCDGWRAEGSIPKNLEPLIEHFDPETEKFYVVGGHVFLYAPPSSARP